MHFLGGDAGPEASQQFDAGLWATMAMGTLRERGWIVGLLVVLSVGAGAVRTLSMPKVYRATSTIQYDPNPAKPLGSEVEDVADPTSSYWATQEFFQTENLVIGSIELARRVVKSLALRDDGMYAPELVGDARSVENIAVELQKHVVVEPVEDTRLVRIHVEDTDPSRAQRLANAVASEYVDKTVEERFASGVQANQWLSDQLQVLRQELDGAEHALHDFKKEHDVLSVSMEDRQNLVATNIQTINTRLMDVQNRRIEAVARVERLQKAFRVAGTGLDPVFAQEHPLLGELLVELHHKRTERQNLAVKYGEKHPSMLTVDAELRAMVQKLETEKKMLLTSAKSDLEQVRRVEQGLKSAAKEAHSSGMTLNLKEIEYRRLNRERDNKAQLYELVLQRRAETHLTRMLKTTHARFMDHATLPTSAVSPRVWLNIAASLILGLLAGVFVVLVLVLFDSRVRSIERLEHFGASVLGVVPPLAPSENVIRLSHAPQDDEEDTPRELVVHEQPMSAGAESFRMIRTNLAFMSESSRPQALLIASSDPREGKTTVAANLAVTFAKFGQTVLLVDADLRRPRLHKLFGLNKDPGLSSYATLGPDEEAQAAVRTTNIQGLDLLAAGTPGDSTAAILHSRPFETFLQGARDKYDWIVFDSPPLSAVADAAMVAPQVDGVLLVVRAGDTKGEAVKSSMRALGDVSANVLGFVLNDVDTQMRFYGKGKHAYAYAYGYGDDPSAADSDADAA